MIADLLAVRWIEVELNWKQVCLSVGRRLLPNLFGESLKQVCWTVEQWLIANLCALKWIEFELNSKQVCWSVERWLIADLLTVSL